MFVLAGWADRGTKRKYENVRVCERINHLHTITGIGRINWRVSTFEQFVVPELELSIGKFDVARHFTCNCLSVKGHDFIVSNSYMNSNVHDIIE
jgi:hypothetical protein